MTKEKQLEPKVNTKALSFLIWDLDNSATIDELEEDGNIDTLVQVINLDYPDEVQPDGDFIWTTMPLMEGVLGLEHWDGEKELTVHDVLKVYNNLVSVSPVFGKIFEFTWNTNNSSREVLLGKLKVSPEEAKDLLKEAGYDVEF